MALLQWGTEAQKQKYLVPQARGDQYAGFCLTEPGAGSDVASMTARAVKKGDSYILNGEKMWISLATHAHNFLVFAKTNPEKEHYGITAFIVERDMPGVTTGDIHGKLGVRAGSTGWVNMEDVEVPAENVLGEEGEGFKIAMTCLDNGRYTVGAGATGLIRACLEESVSYCHERDTFGKSIGKHQLVKQKIAHMKLWYDQAQMMMYRVGWLKNEGIRNTQETSQFKWFSTDHSVKAALEAVQIHGAYGFSDEYPVERYLRNSKGAVIYEGTSEIHQLMQADYELGYRKDKPIRCELPAYDDEFFTAEAAPEAVGD
jgi:glutaryl-CoA dehydrogenase (non-decarboxylating)